MGIESDDLIEKRWSQIEALAGGREWLDEQARATGALERSRKVKDGSQLLRLALGYATTTRSLRLAAAWGAPVVLATDFSDVALLKRLRASGDFLSAVLTRLLAQMEGCASGIGWEGPPIRLVDGSLFCGPGSAGGQHRLHASYDPVRQCFSALDLSPVAKGESLLHAGLEAGAIAVADRNFAKTPQLRALDEKKAFYAVRTGLHGIRLLDAASGKRLTSDRVLTALGEQEEVRLEVILEETKIAKAHKPAPLAAHLIITRAGDAAQSREEARIRRSRTRYGVEPTQGTKDLAGLVLFLTNLPELEWPIAKVRALYRLRWQIELAFKTLKSAFQMRDVPAKEPRLARTWILANLVAVLLTNLLAEAIEQATSPSAA